MDLYLLSRYNFTVVGCRYRAGFGDREIVLSCHKRQSEFRYLPFVWSHHALRDFVFFHIRSRSMHVSIKIFCSFFIVFSMFRRHDC